MIYIVAVFLPPLGLLLNGQPFAAMFNVALVIPCLLFGLLFHPLLLVPSLHAVVAVHMKREERRHREIVAGDRAARAAARVGADAAQSGYPGVDAWPRGAVV